MKRELPYYTIKKYFGGSQSWFMDPWMRLGGCAALAAVDTCIYLTLFHKMKNLCPEEIDVRHLTKDRYRRFGMVMKPFLPPRFSGVNKLHLFTDGLEDYLRSRNNHSFTMEHYAMGCPLEKAQETLTRQIDDNLLIPFLLLVPISKVWKEFHWHWFILGGYEWREDRLFVKAITYGEYVWLPFDELWDCENVDNGGMILIRPSSEI